MGLLLLLYLAVALAHAVLAPLTTGPDELAHYEYVNFIAKSGRLPESSEERGQAGYKSDQPPLYHLIAALPASLINTEGLPYLKRYSDHLRRQLIGRPRHAWGLFNTEDEGWPYRGEVLRWQVGRWVAILFGMATVLMTFIIARRVFKKGWLALAAAATLAFIPRFALSGSMLNYETALAFFASLFLWILLRIAGGEQQATDDGGCMVDDSPPITPSASPFTFHVSRFTFYALLLGLFAGLAITTKLSALILGVEIFLGLGLIARYQGWGRQRWGTGVLLAGLALLVTLSGWYGFVLYHFNTVAEEGWWVGLLRPLIAADPSDATTNRLLSLLTEGEAGAVQDAGDDPFWRWPVIFFRSFWMAGIEGEMPLGRLGLGVALGFTLWALAGILVAWRQDTGDESHSSLPARSQKLILSLLLLHVGLGLVLPLTRFLATWSLADTAQGRHLLFLAAPAVAILLIRGIQEGAVWWKKEAETQEGRGAGEFESHAPRTTPYTPPFVLFLLPAFLLAWSLVQLQTMSWAYLPPLPVQTVPEARAEVVRPLAATLNEAITLLGYDRRLDPENRMVAVDLWWEATALSPVDYLTEVSLMDAGGAVRSRWLGHPAEGRYPTRAWDVGDIVRERVWLPVGGLESGQYTLKLRLVPVTTPLLVASNTPDQAEISLGSLTLTESTLRIFEHNLSFVSEVARAAGGYSVWQGGRPLTAPETFTYRETILITMHPALAGQERTVRLLGPALAAGEYDHAFAPVWEGEDEVLFIVGPDWPNGEYRLQVSVAAPGLEEQQASTDILLRVQNRWDRTFTEPEIPHRLEANFAEQVMLLGYALGANRAEVGGTIPLTLYWQGLDWMGENYTVFTKLLAADGTVYGGRDRLPQEGYSTLYWAPGEVVVDSFGVPVAANAPDGIYTLNVGLYRAVNGQAQSLPLVQAGQALEITSLDLGPVKVGQTPPGFTLAQANPQHRLDQPLGAGPDLTLIGYDLGEESKQLKLKLYWRAEVMLPLDYTTFVHLRNEAGETVAQRDQPPLGGTYPTTLWEPGEIVADEIVIPLPPELNGSYSLVIGMYDFKTGVRLPVPGHPEDGVELGRWELKS